MTWLAILGCVVGALAVDALLDPDRRASVARWWRSRPRWELTVDFHEPTRRAVNPRSPPQGSGAVPPNPDPLALRPGLPSASDWAELSDAVGEVARTLHETGAVRLPTRPWLGRLPKVACMRTSCEGAPLDDRYPRGWEPHPRSTDICMACYKRDGR